MDQGFVKPIIITPKMHLTPCLHLPALDDALEERCLMGLAGFPNTESIINYY